MGIPRNIPHTCTSVEIRDARLCLWIFNEENVHQLRDESVPSGFSLPTQISSDHQHFFLLLATYFGFVVTSVCLNLWLWFVSGTEEIELYKLQNFLINFVGYM